MHQKMNADAYLQGIYAPVYEERTQTATVIQGEIPKEINGMYVQNNPNPQFRPEGLYHWFDGDGMVHGLQLRDGVATYRNRFIKTLAFQQEAAVGKPLWRGIMEPIDLQHPGGPDKDTANTDLVVHNGKLLALWWLGGTPYELSLPDLDTLGPRHFTAAAGCKVSAHPKIDPTTGEMIFFDYQVYKAPYLQYGVLSREGALTHHTIIDLPGPRLQHDIAMTTAHTIFLDMPMTWDQTGLDRGRRKVRFDPGQPTRFGVLPRYATGDQIRWFEVPACYIYHTVNAWEQTTPAGDHEIVLWGCRIESPIPTRPHEEEPHIPRLAFLRLNPFMTEWRLNLSTGAVSERTIDDVPAEFPRMDGRRLGSKSRYAYAQRIATEGTLLFDGVISYDHDTGRSATHSWGAGRFGGEAVFVQRGQAETDGYLMTFVNDRAAGTTDLVIVDAAQLSAEPVATVRLPARVPMGFHAEWVGQ